MITQSYDMQVDALYIGLVQGDVARTDRIDPGTLVDVDAAGHLIGIEVIHPLRSWPLEEILSRFQIAAAQASELRAYFPMPPTTSLPAAPLDAGLRVAINA